MISGINKNKLSNSFIKKLAEISAGYLPPQSFENLINLFETEIAGKPFGNNVEANLFRIIFGMYDKISFFNDCISYPHYVELIVSIASYSNYLSDILVRNPEYFYWIVNPSNLAAALKQEATSISIKKLTASYKSFNAKVNALRTFKRKEILRIGAKDIFYHTPLKEVTGDLSVLAKEIAAELFAICYQEVLIKHGIKENVRKYSLIALGKLGGAELNYSSDIDLMIFYDEDEQVTLKKHFQEILIEAIYLFIESSSRITEAGYLYRIDFRLRPDGRNSPLTRTLDYYLSYYESRGEHWEKQMLIKASFVGGDIALYNRFKNYLSPLIYPSSFLIPPTEQIKKLKQSIEKKSGADDNIKLSAGGIRDIEFSVQALQLIYAGKNKLLRTQNTLNTIDALYETHLLTKEEAEVFTASYIFFRRIEHFLQLMNDKQTHVIPSEGEVLESLSLFLGFKSSSEFKLEVNNMRSSVAAIYNSIIGANKNPVLKPGKTILFENKLRAEKDLVFLGEGKGLLGQRQFDIDTLSSFSAIENELLTYLSNSLNPDLVLQNFARIMRSESFPSIWYKEFSNTKYFNSFLILCEYSKKAVDFFAEDEDLREFFLTRKAFEKIDLKSFDKYSSRRMFFSLLVQFTLKLISAEQVSKYLSTFIRKKIVSITASEPVGAKIETDFFIASLGSFGSSDLSFSSDIDVIFVVEEVSTHIDVQKYFQLLFLKLKEELKPFELDCRLRPEGKSSWLVWDLKSYDHYLLNRARIWEFQAFCKMSFVHGNKKLYNRFLKIIKKRIEEKDKRRIKNDIREMRKALYPQNISSIAKVINIKKSRGGITDIEFVIQYLILVNPELFLKCAGKNTIAVIRKIISYNNEYSDLQIFTDNFLLLKNLELVNQNIFNTATNIIPDGKKKIHTLSSFMNYFPDEFTKTLTHILKSNHNLYDKYLGK